ncbi:MAG: transcription termination factor Rho [Bacteroidota bacterium]
MARTPSAKRAEQDATAASPASQDTQAQPDSPDAADAAEATEQAEAPQKRTRRTRANKTEAGQADAASDDAASDDAASDDAASDDAKPKPRRRSTRSKKAETAEAGTPAEAPATEAPAAEAANEAPAAEASSTEAPAADEAQGDAPAAPKPRRRRTRRKAEPQPVASSDDLQDDAPIASSDDAPQARDDAAQARDDAAQARDDAGEADSDEQERPSRNGRSKRSKRSRSKKGNKGGGNSKPGVPFEGMLEMIGDKKFGFIRDLHYALPKGDNDSFMPPPLIQKFNIRDGAVIKGELKPGRKGAMQVSQVDAVMGMEPEEWKQLEDFDRGLVVYPNEKFNLVTSPTDISMRTIELVAPLGKGQRALIVAPPRTGKTVMLKKLANGIAHNHPDTKLIALLIDERPEEVTDFIRNTPARVFASSNDFQEDNHVRVATLAFEYARRLVEQGNDVVMLLDSITRLGRTFNMFKGGSGRTMSGGLDAKALVVPRRIFGAARNIEGGGSLTIIATALIETGSRMDDVIFEEFKGTGNAEIVLDRELADKRIFPAINLRKSGTRNEERLLGDATVQHHMLLRALNSRHPVEAMQALIKHIQLSPTNAHLLNELIPAEL